MPPTPINSPGEASIEAALNPAEGDWLYYVLADEDGSPLLHRRLRRLQPGGARAPDKGLL